MMADNLLKGIRLVVDDPSMFLDDRGNPRTGRKLIFRGEDETSYEVNLTMQEYRDPAVTKAKLTELVTAHNALKSFV
jgi:hypothetical protein